MTANIPVLIGVTSGFFERLRFRIMNTEAMAMIIRIAERAIPIIPPSGRADEDGEVELELSSTEDIRELDLRNGIGLVRQHDAVGFLEQ